MSLPAVLRSLRVALILLLSSLAAAPAAQAGRSSGGSTAGKVDRTPPVVSVATPTSGAIAQGTLSVTGTASDNVGVTRVEVSVDGGTAKVASGTSSWTTAVDTTAYADGSHTITARALDASGRSASAGVSVIVRNATAPANNAPTVTIVSPSAGATVPRRVTISGTAADDSGTPTVEVKLDDGTYRAVSGGASWTAELDASALADGTHVIMARATDAQGKVGTAAVSVTMVSQQAVQAPVVPAGSIGGFVFQESDRDGVFEVGEQPLEGVYVYAYDSMGVYLGNALTDASGWYEFSGRADGSYRVQIAPISWNALRSDWVPDTTGTIFPRTNVQLASQARVDFGLRSIRRSTDVAAPISTYLGPNGLEVESFNDAVSARDVYDRVLTGGLIGDEARDVTVRLDITSGGITSTMMLDRDGVPSEYHATSNISWLGWLRSDGELFHEYGHAWSGFYAFMVQNDRTLAGYLQARGLAGDARLNSNYSWMPAEMIAEDYRQLFGNPSAQAPEQSNRDIPVAADVPGLREFLSTTFRQPPAR